MGPSAAPSGFRPSRVPDASVRIALRVGWRAGVGSTPSAPTGVGRAAALGAVAWPRRSSGALAWRGPQARAARPDETMGPRVAAVAAAAAPADSGGAGEGAPADADPGASLADASVRSPGSAKDRRFGSDRRGAWGATGRRAEPTGASGTGEPSLTVAAWTTLSDASAASGASLQSVFGTLRGAFRAEFPGVFASV